MANLRRRNWPGNLISTPDRLVVPRTLAEVDEALAAGSAPFVVRGGMHSWAPIAVQDHGTALDLASLESPPIVDHDRRAITVSAGILLADLYEVLAAHNLALTAIPQVTTATVGGALGTATHGAHRVDASFAVQVLALELVDARRRRIRVDAEGCRDLGGTGLLIAGPGPLSAARHHRGALGVVHRVTFGCQPTYDLEHVDAVVTEAEAFGADGAVLRTFFDGSEYASAIWFVHDDRVLLRRADRTTAPRRPRGPLTRLLVDELVRKQLASLALRASRHSPTLGAGFAALGSRALPRHSVLRDRWDRVQTYLPSHATRAVGLRLMEYEVTLDHLGPALEIVREATRVFRPSMPVGVRRTGDRFHLELMWQDRYPGAVEGARDLERRLVDAFAGDALPHDGKLHWIDDWPRRPAADREAFLTLRRELDPDGIFGSDSVRSSLGGGQS